MKTKQELKQFFETNDTPTQQDFYDWMDSYWHKEDLEDIIPANRVGIDLSIKADLINGKIPSDQLPSYVDDVLEFEKTEDFPVDGEGGKIYFTLNTNKVYRWTGSKYIEIFETPDVSTLDYIPITGTVEGKPVKGNIEISDAVNFTAQANGGPFYIGRKGKDFSYICIPPEYDNLERNSDILISSLGIEGGLPAETSSRGIIGNMDFTPNIQDFDFVQKKYVDNKSNIPASSTQSGIVNNIALQELGGVDKTINGVRIGRGNGDTPTITSDNTALGNSTLLSNTKGISNTGIGSCALQFNTIGNYNAGFGDYTLWQNTTGIWNTAIGSASLAYNTTGQRNVACGSALYYNTTGSRNTGVGLNASYKNTTGSNNTAVGERSLYNAQTVNNNTAIGALALYGNTTGTSNIGIGYNSAANITTGSNNIIIGSVNAPSATLSNQLNIGNWIYGLNGNIGIGANVTSPNSTLQIAGSLSTNYRTISAATTLTDVDYTIHIIGTSAFTQALLATAGRVGRELEFVNESTGIITLQGNASESIGSTNTYNLPSGSSVKLKSTGTKWIMIAKY